MATSDVVQSRAMLQSLVGHYGHLGQPRTGKLSSALSLGRSQRPQVPRLAPDPSALAAAKQLANAGGTGTVGGSTPTNTPVLAINPVTEQVQTSFAGMSYEQENLQFVPDDQSGLWPPDTQIAVGPNNVVETVNSTLSIWSRSNLLLPPVVGDLNAFWISPDDEATYMASNPRLLYDSASGLWFAASMAVDSGMQNGRVYVAVSQTSDPTQNWNLYTVEPYSTQTIYLEPRLAVTSDKIVMTWDDYATASAPATFSGEETWVFDKTQLSTGVQFPASWNTGPDTTRVAIVPSQSLTATTTAFLVYNNTHQLPGNTAQSPALGVIELTGSALTTIVSTEVDVVIQATSVPPDALQPAGGPPIATEDDRIQSVAWWNNELWVVGNDACNPDATVRACLRVSEIDTATAPLRLDQSFDVSTAGTYLFDPAVTVDGSGNQYFSFSETSAQSTQYGSTTTVALPAGGAFGNLTSPVTTMSGLGVANVCGGSCQGSPNNNNAWGSYSAAAPDPLNPASAWVAAEYAGSASDPLDWGTGIAQVTLIESAPTQTASLTATATPSPIPTITAVGGTSTPSSTATPTMNPTATPLAFQLTPGMHSQITTNVGGSVVQLDIPAGETIASISIDTPATPLPISPGNPAYHPIFGVAMVIVARDAESNLVTSLNTPLSITIYFRPLGLNPLLARLYTLDASNNPQALMTTIGAPTFGQYPATASVPHLSPFELFAPNPGAKVPEAYIPLILDEANPSGW